MSDEISDDDSFESADEDELPLPPNPKAETSLIQRLESLQVSANNDSCEEANCTETEKPRDIPQASTTIVTLTTVDTSTKIGEVKPVVANTTPAPVAPASLTAPSKTPVADSWSSWGSWGASLLSTASQSVSQFSNEVTEGLNVLVDASIADVDEVENDEVAEKAALEVKEGVVESQPAVDIPAISTGRLPPEDPGCPSSDISTSVSSSSTLSSLTSGFFSSASSFSSASAAAGFSSAFGVAQRNLPTLSSFSAALSSSKHDDDSSSSSSALTSPSVAGEKLAGLMEGGLGVLEMVGRKTMDILKESDGGLEVTRAIFDDRKGKPTLSDLLREGKTKSEMEDGKKEEILEERKKSFQYWFDEYKGMAHLEALELLNNCCETDIKEIVTSDDYDVSLNPALVTIKNIFIRDDDDDGDDENEVSSFTEDEERVLRQMMRKHAEQFGAASATTNPVDHFVDSVREAWQEVEKMESLVGMSIIPEESTKRDDESESPKGISDSTNPADVHRSCIQSLANMVAKSVGLFHKIGQMSLMPIAADSATSVTSAAFIDSFVERISHLAFLSKLLTANIDGAATAFGQSLSKFEGRRSEIEINQVMTDIFLEASQGTSHVRSAFKLLLPVMQVRYLKASEQHQD